MQAGFKSGLRRGAADLTRRGRPFHNSEADTAKAQVPLILSLGHLEIQRSESSWCTMCCYELGNVRGSHAVRGFKCYQQDLKRKSKTYWKSV